MLSPITTLLLKCAKSDRILRKYLKSQILPPLRDVTKRPEEGDTLRNYLCRLLTTYIVQLRDLVAELLFVLCKENSKFILFIILIRDIVLSEGTLKYSMWFSAKPSKLAEQDHSLMLWVYYCISDNRITIIYPFLVKDKLDTQEDQRINNLAFMEIKGIKAKISIFHLH